MVKWIQVSAQRCKKSQHSVRERHVEEQVAMQSLVWPNGLARQGFVKVFLYWGEPASGHGAVARGAGVRRLRAGSWCEGGPQCLQRKAGGLQGFFRLACYSFY